MCVCLRAERFQPAERSDWRKTSDLLENMADFQHVQPLWTTRDVSIRVHEGFRWVKRDSERKRCRSVCSPLPKHLPSPVWSMQSVGPVLSRLPGGLRRVERGGGVHVSRAAPHRSVQPAGAVPQPGVPLPVHPLPAAGRQHGGHLRQVKQENLHRKLSWSIERLSVMFFPTQDSRDHSKCQIFTTRLLWPKEFTITVLSRYL